MKEMDSMDLGLNNKIAIVTGASKGMGFACVQALASEGVKILMIARNKDDLLIAAENVNVSKENIMTLAGDVADPGLASTALEKCKDYWGDVDILVNNAGGPPVGSFLVHDEEAWNSAIQTNLMGAIRFTRVVAFGMKNKQWGRIISITSTVAKEPSALMVLSATARAGLAAFTKSISVELAESNITANVVCPGGVLTGRLTSLLQAKSNRENRDYEVLLKESQESIPAKRFAEPKEIADVILFLASEAGGYITGVSLSVDGGLSKGYM